VVNISLAPIHTDILHAMYISHITINISFQTELIFPKYMLSLIFQGGRSMIMFRPEYNSEEKA
jgi:hypothetical protein